MNLFLRAKHWQLFLVMFGLPFLFQIIMMCVIIFNAVQNHNPNMFFDYFALFPLIMVIFMAAFFWWMWSIANGLQKFVPPAIKMGTILFKIFFIIPLVYIIFLFSAFGFIFSTQSFFDIEPGMGMAIGFMVIFPIHLFCIFCVFYCLYFTSKTIKLVELQRAVTFSDYAGEFFLIWFYPIGVWIIQPKINKLAQQAPPVNF